MPEKTQHGQRTQVDIEILALDSPARPQDHLARGEYCSISGRSVNEQFGWYCGTLAGFEAAERKGEGDEQAQSAQAAAGIIGQ